MNCWEILISSQLCLLVYPNPNADAGCLFTQDFMRGPHGFLSASDSNLAICPITFIVGSTLETHSHLLMVHDRDDDTTLSGRWVFVTVSNQILPDIM